MLRIVPLPRLVYVKQVPGLLIPHRLSVHKHGHAQSVQLAPLLTNLTEQHRDWVWMQAMHRQRQLTGLSRGVQMCDSMDWSSQLLTELGSCWYD
mgnify:CR=1 FL=1